MTTSLAQRTNCYLYCIRSLVLALAIIITSASLCIYSTNTQSLSSLFSNRYHHAAPIQQASFHTDDTTTATTTSIMIQMIQDRRLISTLVAAQASIFCPLFLLVNHNNNNKAAQATTTTTKVVLSIEQLLCQLLMPAGLAISWVFSILFDLKTLSVISHDIPLVPRLYRFLSPQTQDMCLFDRSSSQYARHLCAIVNGVHYLKYAMIFILILDFALVLTAALAAYYEKAIQEPKEGSIRLVDEQEQAYQVVVVASSSDKQQHEGEDEQQRMALFHAQALV
ncbi:hypothetical protein O0I10_002862 [Lichtheimia ornata]|uniref:Uncharacterized protein n=1 Tax=Lichtheimia ornata TaxID=688661 RepID=A0AAD7XY82_9FUNG|nr:uncharacterized protein O0I10_002862 [Lichtheimia ornata]KAJ8661594.1 hypothetical protein O0I10_002862 [Lichtheimia ornata]